MKTVAKAPCKSCPYRKDVPSGVWAEHEYDKLPDYDGEIMDQVASGATMLFDCHQRDGCLCAGWVATHGARDLLAMRLNADKVDLSGGLGLQVAGPGICVGARGLRSRQAGYGAARPEGKARRLPVDKNARAVMIEVVILGLVAVLAVAAVVLTFTGFHGPDESVVERFMQGEHRMRQFDHLSDAELIAKTAEARTAAHGAGLASMTHVNKNGKPTGERIIGIHTQGYADRANDWASLSDEVTARGLPQPQCLCPGKDANGVCVKS